MKDCDHDIVFTYRSLLPCESTQDRPKMEKYEVIEHDLTTGRSCSSAANENLKFQLNCFFMFVKSFSSFILYHFSLLPIQ